MGAEMNDPRRAMGVDVEELQAFYARGIKLIVDVLRQICANVGLAQTQARRPFLHDPVKIQRFHSVVS